MRLWSRCRLLAGHVFDGVDALFLGLVGEHGALHHVPDGVDVRVGGAQVAIHLHAAAVVEGDAGLVQPESLGVGLAAHRHQAVIRFPGDFLASSCCRP